MNTNNNYYFCISCVLTINTMLSCQKPKRRQPNRNRTLPMCRNSATDQLPPIYTFEKKCILCGHHKTFRSNKKLNRCTATCGIHRMWTQATNAEPSTDESDAEATSTRATIESADLPNAKRAKHISSPSTTIETIVLEGFNNLTQQSDGATATAVAVEDDDHDDSDSDSDEGASIDADDMRLTFHRHFIQPELTALSICMDQELTAARHIDFSLSTPDRLTDGFQIGVTTIQNVVDRLWNELSRPPQATFATVHEWLGGKECVHKSWVREAAIDAGWLRRRWSNKLYFPTLQQHADAADDDNDDEQDVGDDSDSSINY
jgi:hypothetical protein